MHIKELIGKGFGVAGVRAFGAMVLFALNILIARLLDVDNYGIFSLGFTIISILAVLAKLGLDKIILKQVSSNIEHAPDLAKGYFKSSLSLVIIVSLFLAIFLFLSSGIVSEKIFKMPELEKVLKLFSLGLVCFPTIFLTAEYFKAIERPALAAILQTVLIPLFALLSLCLLYLWGRLSLNLVVGCYLISLYVTLSYALLLCSKGLPKVIAKRIHWLELIKQGWPMLLITSGALIMGWTGVIVLGIFSNSQAVGIYSAASRTVMITSLVLVAINSITSPQFAKLYKQGKMEELIKIAKNASVLLLLASVGSGVILLVFATQILNLFGKSFIEGSSVLRILTLGQMVNVACGSVLALMTMTGGEKKLRDIFLITAFINIVLSVIFVQLYQEIGVALATAISLSIWNIWGMIEIRKRLGFWTIHPKSLQNTSI